MKEAGVGESFSQRSSVTCDGLLTTFCDVWRTHRMGRVLSFGSACFRSLEAYPISLLIDQEIPTKPYPSSRIKSDFCFELVGTTFSTRCQSQDEGWKFGLDILARQHAHRLLAICSSTRQGQREHKPSRRSYQSIRSPKSRYLRTPRARLHRSPISLSTSFLEAVV